MSDTDLMNHYINAYNIPRANDVSVIRVDKHIRIKRQNNDTNQVMVQLF